MAEEGKPLAGVFRRFISLVPPVFAACPPLSLITRRWAPGGPSDEFLPIDADVNDINAVRISLVSFTFCSLFSSTLLGEGDMVVGGDKNCAAFIPCPGSTPRDAHSSQPQNIIRSLTSNHHHLR